MRSALPGLALLSVGAAADVGLRDHPIATSAAPTYLDGQWTASSGASLHGAAPINISVPAWVPGDLLTDLQKAKVIADPWLDTTWLDNSSLWTEHEWTYTTHFSVESSAVLDDASALQLLVFEGVKMGATVRVNGHIVGVVADQFLRYKFTLGSAVGLLPGPRANRLDVTFAEDVPEDGRFMACTGGWDWAPYSYTNSTSGGNHTAAQTFSKGIWKSVYLITVPAATVAITHVTPHTRYMGKFPTARLADGEHGGFAVNVTAHLWAPPGGANGALTVAGSWAGVSTESGDNSSPAMATSGATTLPAGDSLISLQLTASAAQIKLWWPTGVGAQPLYTVSATWTPTPKAAPAAPAASSSAATVSTTSRQMGFRVFALVTVNDTNATIRDSNASAQVTGQVNDTGTFGMFFRINGAALYSRGANMIPMEELEGRMDGEAHRILVKSSADAGMNTLRVWGGGIFYPDAFYDACDEFGVLVYHDMQYSSDAYETHGPIATTTQDAELRHQIRRLSHHPAIVLWDGNNEHPMNIWAPSGLFASFVMTVVAQEDQMRAVWPSSPSRGWATGVHRLYGTPNWDSPQGMFTQGGGHSWTGGIESHAPYQTGGADNFPTVNGGAADTCFIQNGMGNGVNLPSVFKPPHGVGPPPRAHNAKCYAAIKTTCAAYLHNDTDCRNCRNAPGAWDKLKAVCGKTPIQTYMYHTSCESFLSFGQKGDSVTANGHMGETVYKVTSQFLLVVRNSKYPKTRGIVGEDSANR